MKQTKKTHTQTMNEFPLMRCIRDGANEFCAYLLKNVYKRWHVICMLNGQSLIGFDKLQKPQMSTKQ